MKKIIVSILVFLLIFSNFSAFAQTQIPKTFDENGCRVGVEMLIDGKCEDPSSVESLYRWAKKVGFTTTSNLKEFNPTSNITREEVSAIIARGFKNGVFQDTNIAPAIITEKFLDQNQIAPEFVETAKFVQDRGIVRGDNGYFRPKRNISMYESALVLIRANDMGDIPAEQEAEARDWIKKSSHNNNANRHFFFYLTRLMVDEAVSDFQDNYVDLSKAVNVGLDGDISSDQMKSFMEGEWNLAFYRQWDYVPEEIPADFDLKITQNSISHTLCGKYTAEMSWINNFAAFYDWKWIGGNEVPYCEGLRKEMRSFFSLTNAKVEGRVIDGSDILSIWTKDGKVHYAFERK